MEVLELMAHSTVLITLNLIVDISAYWIYKFRNDQILEFTRKIKYYGIFQKLLSFRFNFLNNRDI